MMPSYPYNNNDTDIARIDSPHMRTDTYSGGKAREEGKAAGTSVRQGDPLRDRSQIQPYNIKTVNSGVWALERKVGTEGGSAGTNLGCIAEESGGSVCNKTVVAVEALVSCLKPSGVVGGCIVVPGAKHDDEGGTEERCKGPADCISNTAISTNTTTHKTQTAQQADDRFINWLQKGVRGSSPPARSVAGAIDSCDVEVLGWVVDSCELSRSASSPVSRMQERSTRISGEVQDCKDMQRLDFSDMPQEARWNYKQADCVDVVLSKVVSCDVASVSHSHEEFCDDELGRGNCSSSNSSNCNSSTMEQKVCTPVYFCGNPAVDRHPAGPSSSGEEVPTHVLGQACDGLRDGLIPNKESGRLGEANVQGPIQATVISGTHVIFPTCVLPTCVEGTDSESPAGRVTGYHSLSADCVSQRITLDCKPLDDGIHIVPAPSSSTGSSSSSGAGAGVDGTLGADCQSFGSVSVSVCRNDRDVINGSQQPHLSLLPVDSDSYGASGFAAVEPEVVVFDAECERVVNTSAKTVRIADDIERVDPRPLGEPTHKARLTTRERKDLKRHGRRADLPVAGSPDDVECALRGCDLFFGLPKGSATLVLVQSSSAGVLGWASYERTMLHVADRDRDQRQVLGALGIDVQKEVVAKRVSFDDDYPKPGLCLFEVADPIGDQSELLANEAWQDVEFEVALDSGSQDHVCDEIDCPGYVTEPSPGSMRGQCFIVGNGGRLDNKGQRSLNLEPLNDDSTPLKSCFQIAKVTRPLMSVGRICDNGMKVEFTHNKAIVINPEGVHVCAFERKPGGLYTCKFRLKNPMSGFTRQG